MDVINLILNCEEYVIVPATTKNFGSKLNTKKPISTSRSSPSHYSALYHKKGDKDIQVYYESTTIEPARYCVPVSVFKAFRGLEKGSFKSNLGKTY